VAITSQDVAATRAFESVGARRIFRFMGQITGAALHARARAPYAHAPMTPRRLSVGVIVGAVLLLAALTGFVREYSGDFHWHVVLGDWMLAHHRIYRADTFSYTFPGRPMFVQGWLGEVILALAFRAGGYPACFVLRALALVAMVGLLVREMTRRGVGATT